MACGEVAHNGTLPGVPLDKIRFSSLSVGRTGGGSGD